MNRRAFLSLSALTPWASLLPVYARSPAPDAQELRADVVIIGAGLGGCAAALAAAREGLSVILTEETDWIGGQLTSQAVPPDEHPWIEERGCTKLYRQFRDGVRRYYQTHYPLTAAAKGIKNFNPGSGTVSKLCHEPRVALAALLELLAPFITNGHIRLLQPHRVESVEVHKDRIAAVRVKNLRTENATVLNAPYYVDGTELGDLLALGKVEHVTGAEARKTTSEPHAKEIAEPLNHQAFTWCFAMSYHEGEDHTITKPAGYGFWSEYIPVMKPAWPGKLLSWEMSQHNDTSKVRKVDFQPTAASAPGKLNLWTYRRIVDRKHWSAPQPADVCLVNWPQNDYWLGNLFGEKAPEHAQRGKQLSLSLLYWMQTAAPRGDEKAGWKGLKLRPDLVGTDDGLAMAPYVRESRRILSEFTVTENHVGTEARMKLTGKKLGEVTADLFPDTVGIGSYRIDLHPSSGGDNYIDVSSLPFQIPLGSLIPQRIENLLPACKNLGTTHITNGCYRLHPVEWNIGESVGVLIAYCLAKKEPPRAVRKNEKLLNNYQAELVKAGVELEWPAAIAKSAR